MTLPTDTRGSINTVALLGAFCLFLSAVEFMIPKPLPFLRLGLANLPVLLGLTILSPGRLMSLVVVKILGQGLINGTLFSYIFLFSAAGSIISGVVMVAAYRFGHRVFSYVGISLFGALASNLVQLFFSRLTVFGENAWIIAPPFLAAGGATAILLGLFAGRFARVSVWMKTLQTGRIDDRKTDNSIPLNMERGKAWGKSTAGGLSLMAGTSPGYRFFCGLIVMFTFVLQESLPVRAVQAAVFTILSILAGKSYRFLPVFIMIAVITFINLMTPHGKILISAGSLRITSGALELGLKKGLMLAGLIVISRSFVSSRLALPGRWGTLLGMTLKNFEIITENRKVFDPKHPVKTLDEMMISLHEIRGNNVPSGAPEAERLRPGIIDRFLPAFLVVLNVFVLIFLKF